MLRNLLTSVKVDYRVILSARVPYLSLWMLLSKSIFINCMCDMMTCIDRSSVGDPNPKGSERFEGSESDQTIRIRKDPNANFVE